MSNNPSDNPYAARRRERADEVVTYEQETEKTRNNIFAVLAVCGAVAISGAVYLGQNSSPHYPKEQVEKAIAMKNEMMGGEAALMQKYGGQIFNMQRLPEMVSNHPTARGNVYVRIPEKTGEKRLLIYLHGNGDQSFKDDGSTGNIVACAQKLGLPMIAPQDGWGNRHSEKNGLPGNWEDLNDPVFLSTLVRFAENQMGHSAKRIILGSFSGGNIGVSKILRSLERSDKSEAKDLYRRIRTIAFFDSADGQERDYVARWMSANSDASVFSCYNENAGGLKGRVYDGDRVYKAGNDLLLKALQEKKVDASRIHIDEIPKKYTMGHGVRPDKCEEYLKD